MINWTCKFCKLATCSKWAHTSGWEIPSNSWGRHICVRLPYKSSNSQNRLIILKEALSNENKTEWSTIQGVLIERVISNQLENDLKLRAWLPWKKMYDTNLYNKVRERSLFYFYISWQFSKQKLGLYWTFAETVVTSCSQKENGQNELCDWLKSRSMRVLLWLFPPGCFHKSTVKHCNDS